MTILFAGDTHGDQRWLCRVSEKLRPAALVHLADILIRTIRNTFGGLARRVPAAPEAHSLCSGVRVVGQIVLVWFARRTWRGMQLEGLASS